MEPNSLRVPADCVHSWKLVYSDLVILFNWQSDGSGKGDNFALTTIHHVSILAFICCLDYMSSYHGTVYCATVIYKRTGKCATEKCSHPSSVSAVKRYHSPFISVRLFAIALFPAFPILCKLQHGLTIMRLSSMVIPAASFFCEWSSSKLGWCLNLGAL